MFLDDFVTLGKIFEIISDLISVGILLAVLCQVFNIGLFNLGAVRGLKRKQVNRGNTLPYAEDCSDTAESYYCTDNHKLAEAGPVTSSLLFLLRLHNNIIL